MDHQWINILLSIVSGGVGVKLVDWLIARGQTAASVETTQQQLFASEQKDYRAELRADVELYRKRCHELEDENRKLRDENDGLKGDQINAQVMSLDLKRKIQDQIYKAEERGRLMAAAECAEITRQRDDAIAEARRVKELLPLPEVEGP